MRLRAPEIRRSSLTAAVAVALLAASPAGAVRAVDPASGQWSSGYQMGILWASVRAPSGDLVNFTCLDEDTPHVKKGASIRIEASAIAEAQLKPGEPVEVGFGVENGTVKTFSMIVEDGSAMSVTDLPQDRAEAAKMIVALKGARVLSVTFGRNALSFGLTRGRKELADVLACAKAAAKG